MMRAEKGITLVALVITIIVMLILVAVTVTFAVQSGLFTSARDAGNSWEAESAAENDLKVDDFLSGTTVSELTTR